MDFIVMGQITQVCQPQSGVSQRNGQPWQSQEFVLTYEQGQYPKSLVFRVFGSEKLQQFAIRQGETITAHLNIVCQQGQNGRMFNDVSCWKVERQQVGNVQQPPVQQPYAPQPPVQTPFPQQPTAAPAPQPAPQQGGLPFPPAQ